jgi:hypothetical protein
MVINVLKDYYNDEYEMLTFLALDDIENFKYFADTSNNFTNHLVGYNIIDRNNANYSFKIESVKKYLIEERKYKSINQTNEEKSPK